MLKLDVKLSKYFEKLSLIFDSSYLFAQECWLTTFYLHPTAENYRQVQRCGLRLLRCARPEKSAKYLNAERIKQLEQLSLLKNTKYQLLSSTIDVYEIVKHTDNEQMNADYAQLDETVNKLDIPEACIKDLVTVCFAARSRYFAWAVPWPELQKRCKVFLNNALQKRRFVEQSMAEANERLKFLHIDYKKYKHRPMIDYGCIESGYEQDYENVETSFVTDKDSDVDFSETSDDDYEKETNSRKRVKSEKLQESERKDKLLLELDDSCFQGGRRTRARAASALRNQQEQQLDEQPSCSKAAAPVKEIVIEEIERIEEDTENASPPKRNLRELLSKRQAFMNSTEGFKAIRDIWNYTQNDLENVDLSTNELPEVNNSLVFFTGCPALLAQAQKYQEDKLRRSQAQNLIEKRGEEADDTLSEDECLLELAKKLSNSKQALAVKEDNESVAAVSSEIDLQEESDANEVNLQIFFNKHLFDSLEMTNSPDPSFYADTDVLESDMLPNAVEETVNNDDDFTMPIELFEDVPNSAEADEAAKMAKFLLYSPLIQQMRKIIQGVEASGESAIELKKKFNSIMCKWGFEAEQSNDEEDDDDEDVAHFDDEEENSDNDHVEGEQQQQQQQPQDKTENERAEEVEQTNGAPKESPNEISYSAAFLKPILEAYREKLREMLGMKTAELDKNDNNIVEVEEKPKDKSANKVVIIENILLNAGNFTSQIPTRTNVQVEATSNNEANVENEVEESDLGGASPTTSRTDSDTEFLNRLSESNELNAQTETCNKRPISPDLNIEILPIKRAREAEPEPEPVPEPEPQPKPEPETESTQVVERDPPSHSPSPAAATEEILSRPQIDCTSAHWQPLVRLQRLQVVQGHVIRDVRVCVRRLNNNIQYTRKKGKLQSQLHGNNHFKRY